GLEHPIMARGRWKTWRPTYAVKSKRDGGGEELALKEPAWTLTPFCTPAIIGRPCSDRE
ncbi:unnamed protein product, partial [Gadus morhua 'NCC']